MSDYDKLDRIMELHSKIEELQKENARFKDLLWRVLSDDGSRYNRPGYYFEIKKELLGENKHTGSLLQNEYCIDCGADPRIKGFTMCKNCLDDKLR